MGSIECATNKVKIEDVEHWLKPLLMKDETIKFAVSIKAKAAKGEGQLSDVTYVEAKSNTDDPKIYKLAIKSGKTSEAMREMMPLRGICINEINFYREIVPVLVKFQEERKIQHPFNNLAECHDSLILDNMEVLILSNMKEEGYTMHSRMIPLNEEKIKQVVQAYAKFHAVSFALKDQKPEVFAELDKYVKNVLKGTDLEQTLGEKEFFDELQKIAQESNLPQVAAKLQALYKLTDAVDPLDDYAVIIHGDCENNNYLFKHHVSVSFSNWRSFTG
jgi:thiamine kinase-like enzyme